MHARLQGGNGAAERSSTMVLDPDGPLRASWRVLCSERAIAARETARTRLPSSMSWANQERFGRTIGRLFKS